MIYLQCLMYMYFYSFCRNVIFTTKFKRFIRLHVLRNFCHIWYLFIFMSVGWDVKWSPMSRTTTPWHAKDRFSGFRRRVGSWGPPGKLQNFITYHLPNSRRRCMAGILPIRRKPQKQSINLIKTESIQGQRIQTNV